MQAVLTFNLPDEQREYALANKGSSLSCILWDLDQWLRSETKYQELDEKTYEAYDKVRNQLREIMSEHSLTFNDEIFI
jgi:hypothetical protein